jgi:hypothetical protein
MRNFISGTTSGLDLGNDTGANGIIRFMPNNLEKVRIDSSGNIVTSGIIIQNNSGQSNLFLGQVGIGTTNPLSSNLAVEGRSYFKNNVGIGTTDTSSYALNVGGNVFTSGIIIQNNSGQSNIFLGNIGIGTTNPQQKLDINGNLNVSGNINIAGNSTDTIYATNTSLNTLVTKINNTSNLEYTEIKQYPPKPYDSFIIETNKTFLGINAFYETFTINNYINGYGIGTYELYSSTSFAPTRSKKLLFNYILDEITTESTHWSSSQYSNGFYNQNNFIFSDYKGDWIVIKLPNPIILTKFIFYSRQPLINFQDRLPGAWKCYGSMNGINFNEIPEGHNLSRLTTDSYISGSYIKTLDLTFTTPYLYLGWCVNALSGTSSIMNFAELQIFGKELLNPIYNYVSSNVLTSTLLPYTTSNICKNLILYDTPNVRKKFGFTAVCSTSITLPSPNDGITYYKFDINLTNYTKLQNTPGTNTPYRIFNITLFMANVYFEAFTTIPNVLEYKIFMSNPANSGGSGENAGINICALGRPQSYNLNAVLTTNISLVRTSDFNYLSVISKTNGTSFNVIIEDLLF